MFLNRNDGNGEVRLDSVAEGVSVAAVRDSPVFVIRSADSVLVLYAKPQHLPDDELWWCDKEQVFVGPEHGEIFDRLGGKLAGPARRGLDAFASRLDGDDVFVDVTQVTEGEVGLTGTAPPSLATSGADRAWSTGPGSFCDAHLSSESAQG